MKFKRKIIYLILISVLVISSSCSNINIETKNNYEEVELPDGSIAYLNHNSSIKYSKKFN